MQLSHRPFDEIGDKKLPIGHDFRHTFTTWGRRAGVKAETMRDQLGHSSVQITLDIYSHVDAEDAEPAQIEAYGWGNGTLNGTPSGTSKDLTT